MTFDEQFDKVYFDNAVNSVISNNNEKNDEYSNISRYKSWDSCYVYFQYLHKKQKKGNDLNSEEKYLACRSLARYLASWGMYRGSSFILNFDYNVFEEVVNVIFNKEYNVLWGLDDKLTELHNECNDSNLEEIVNLIYTLADALSRALRKYKIYNNNKFYLNPFIANEKDAKGDISTTLITKIMLGTIGCMPAFDTNFRNGIGFSSEDFNKKYIAIVLSIFLNNYDILIEKRNEVGEVEDTNFPCCGKYRYPIMKLLDIYYFTRGAEKDLIDYMHICKEFCKESGNAADWFKSLKLSVDSDKEPDKKKVTKAISQVCYRKDIRDKDSEYDIKMAYPKANEYEEDIKSIIDAGKNKDFMRDYCGGKKIGEEKYKKSYEENSND